MAANSALKVSDPNTDICMAMPEDRDPRPIQRSRRRKVKGGDSCHGQKKKQPQRGMGVAQLELLRMQEWKKMTEINTTNMQTLNFPVASSFVDPTPVQFPKLGGFGAPNIAVGKMCFNNPNERMGFNGLAGFGGFVSDYHFQADSFGVKGSENNQHCTACQEKKKISTVQNVSSCGMKPDFSGCGFLGLNVGQTTYIKRENRGLATKVRPEPNVAYTIRNGLPGVEIVAVHKKGSAPSTTTTSSSEAGNTLVMEYEFFPSGKGVKSNINSNNNEYVMMKLMAGWGSESANIGDQSCCGASNTAALTGFDGSTGSIDLSLKLSY
ncbi:hypothetical protein F511_21578 [Dorcoceras hygrometricum]|uniref:Uncharacterized protein n=1 Tax=Dorcoceras hygrometricum TaxID=472368 RepID=A0A2Z7D8S7_9LAMI|nr:hypothetical protein F511_21578 [Dorcoceras hygrometricum]